MVYDVIVVGSGFSAIAVTCNLIERLPSSASVAIVGDDPGFGRGAAYRTEFHLHRLNVPAGRMSLFPDRPSDFIDWLGSRRRPLDESDFASRCDYGLYLRDTLAGLLRRQGGRCRVDFIKSKAAGCITRNDEPVGFQLENGREIAGRNVVLCLGVGNASLPVEPTGVPAPGQSRIVGNPWRLSWLSCVAPSDGVCILGSGLTMIDQVLALRAHGHQGHIDILSRRGLAPHGHARIPSVPVKVDVQTFPKSISGILRLLRSKAREAGDWRSVMEGLRPLTRQIWQSLPLAERARFLRHALPWWNVHRHRVAPDVLERFKLLIDDGTVRFHAGFLKSIETKEDAGVEARYRMRGLDTTREIKADWLINCIGMERAGVNHSPLLKEAMRIDMISADPLGLGIQVDANSELISRCRDRGSRMFAVGALTAGQFWEITAVPDIRSQAQAVAFSIADNR